MFFQPITDGDLHILSVNFTKFCLKHDTGLVNLSEVLKKFIKVLFSVAKHVRNFIIFFEMCEMCIDTKFRIRIRMRKFIIRKKFAKSL